MDAAFSAVRQNKKKNYTNKKGTAIGYGDRINDINVINIMTDNAMRNTYITW